LSAELDQYYSVSPHQQQYGGDALQYWSAQAKSNNLPILCQLAEIYLGMASASVPVECLFSTAALIANGKRSNLREYKLEQILFVHDNFNFVKEHIFSQ
jgi:hypothetical protein